jgi:cytoskeleton protein RodZ
VTEVHTDLQESAGPSAEAAAVGAQLRRAREIRGETTGDVARSLKLTGRQVEAMEAGRLDLLPGPAFARGFLRNYARYLGIDPAELLAGFESDARTYVELVPVSNAEGVMPSGGAARAAQFPAALVAGALLLVVLAGWYFDWFQMPQENPAAIERAPEHQSLAAPGDLAAPATTPPAAESMASAADASPSMAPVPAAGAPSPQPAAAPPAPTPGAVTSPPTAPVAAVVTPPAAAPAPVAEFPRTDGVEHLVFRFDGESWVEVRDASGSIVYSGVSTAGSRRTVQGKPPFALVVGNARMVSLEYRGKPYDLTPYVRVSVARLTLE